MKPGRTLHELAQEIERQAKSKKDFHADTRRLSMRTTGSSAALGNESNTVYLDGINGGMVLRPIAHAQLAATLQIPKVYYDRMLATQPDLLAGNVNRWLQTQPATKLVRTLDNEVRAILSDSYRPLDNLDLAEAVLPQLQHLEARVVSAEITESRFYLKAITDRVQGEVKVGEVIQAGLAVSNSEVGLGRLQTEFLDYKLACANGMIRESSIRKTHVGRDRGGDALEDAREYFRTETRLADDRAFFLKVRDTVGSMFDQEKFNKRIEQYRDAAEQPIEADPVKVVELTAKRFNMSDEEGSGVLQHLIRGGDLSKWGLANAITRASQDVESYDRATELETLGGRLIELSAAEWLR